MSRLEYMTNSEIAEKLDISLKAVEANITRALKKFRIELKDYITILVLLGVPFQ
jgi:RNA polymerase sigma-70 factor, ECF subfamily